MHSNTTLKGSLSGIGFDASDLAAYGSTVCGFALGTDGQPAINFNETYATFDNGGRNTFRPLSQSLTTFGETLTWVRGKHNLKFGADWVRSWALDGFALNRGNPRGSMTYTDSAQYSGRSRVCGWGTGVVAYTRLDADAAAP